MAELWAPSHSPYNPSFEDNQPKIEIVQPAQKRKTWLPENIQRQVDNITQKIKERKEEELKIESVFQALEQRFWAKFDRKQFDISISNLTQEEIDYLWYEVFLLSKKWWFELSYINEKWKIIVDLTKIDINSFKNLLLWKNWWWNLWKYESWQLFYRWEDGNKYTAESKKFLNHIFKFYLNIDINNTTNKVTVELTLEEIEVIWWQMIAVFEWGQLIRYEIWGKYILDISNIDINNDLWNLLSKKVSNSFFERTKSWEIIWHKKNWEIVSQNENNFHKSFYIQYYGLKRTY